MLPIKFDAAFGDLIKSVEISQPFGTGGDQYQVTIDGYYWGSMWKRGDDWIFHGNSEDKLSSEDIQILGEKIEAANK